MVERAMASEPDLRELEVTLTALDAGDGDPVLSAVKASLSDSQPKWSLHDINAIVKAHEDIELNALDLVPILWDHVTDDESIASFIRLVSERGNSKECIIALQEAQEILVAELSSWDADDHEDNSTGLVLVDRLCVLIDLYSSVIPRLVLRRKGPLDTLKPVLKGIANCIRASAPIVDKQRGRTLLGQVANLTSSIARWVKSLGSLSEEERTNSMDALATLLFSSIAFYCPHIQSHLADEYIESHFPRRYLHSTIDADSTRGREIARQLVDTAETIGISPPRLLKLASGGGQIAISSIVLLSHWPVSKFTPELGQLLKLENEIETFLQKGIATDEILFFILSRANTAGSLQAEGIVQYLVSLSSSTPDEKLRNTAFVTLSVILGKFPPPARLARFAELLSPDDPLPQMRVAIIGLVKESILEALSSPGPSIFASKELFTQIGRYVLRPDPIDLFESSFDGDKFLSTAEPARLIECLGLYYTVLHRDASNKTGVRDRSSMEETERTLLNPLAKALEGQLSTQAQGIDESSMSVISLSIALDRVYDAIRAVSSNS